MGTFANRRHLTLYPCISSDDSDRFVCVFACLCVCMLVCARACTHMCVVSK